MTDADQRFEQLLRQAREDPNILACWLDGSRGKGRPTMHSDYDCALVVRDDAFEAYRERLTATPGLDLQVMTLSQFEAAALWGQPDAWNGYNYAHLTPLVDKTGRIAG